MEFDERVWLSIHSMEKLCKGYKPTTLIRMIDDHGVVEAVKRLINSQKPPEGFTRLCKCNHLELSMENIIQEKEWNDLFTENERRKAKKRLSEYGYGIFKGE
jgi:hypothetical protein